MTEFTRIAIKVVRIMASDDTLRTAGSEEAIEATVMSIDWGNVEVAINEQLPEGYYCKVDDA